MKNIAIIIILIVFFSSFGYSINGDNAHKTGSVVKDEIQKLNTLIKETKEDWSHVKLFFIISFIIGLIAPASAIIYYALKREKDLNYWETYTSSIQMIHPKIFSMGGLCIGVIILMISILLYIFM